MDLTNDILFIIIYVIDYRKRLHSLAKSIFL